MTFKTHNSTYEIDGSRVRRVRGDVAPTERQGHEWREAIFISEPVVGAPVLMVWEIIGNVAKSTITSGVTEVIG